MIDFIQQYPYILAFLVGLLPALVWLWFWLKEDTHPEPAKMLTLSFLGGILSVFIVLPIQKILWESFQGSETLSFTLLAAAEELVKFVVVYFIALRNKCTDEPVDDLIYLIVCALGFVTFENTLFLVGPLHQGEFLDFIIHGNLRFIGASLVHIMSSATIGIFLALSFYKSRGKKVLYGILGVVGAIVLHTAFNLFIINGAPENILFIFGMVWIGILVLLLLFEKVKHLRKPKLS